MIAPTTTTPNPPLRVAYVVHGFDVGGIERCVARLLNGLDAETFLPTVICLTKSGAAESWVIRRDVQIVQLHKGPRNDLGVVRRLTRALRENYIDVVHSHNWGTLVETTLARRFAGTAIHVHAERGTLLGDLNIHGAKRWLRARAMRWALERVDQVVSNAQATAEQIERICGFETQRVRVIPNGVESQAVADAASTRSELRTELGIQDSAIVIGSVGRLAPVKNFSVALDAVAGLRRRGLHVHLLLVGDGTERTALMKQVEHLGLSGYAHLVGHRDDVDRYYAAMDVYINTSLSEGLSQSLIEALSAGLPLVVTDVGDSRWVAESNPECGFAVAAHDVAAFLKCLEQLCTDARLRTWFAIASKQKYLADFSAEQMTRAYATLYQTAVGCLNLTTSLAKC